MEAVQNTFAMPKEFEHSADDTLHVRVDKNFLQEFYHAAINKANMRYSLHDYMHQLTNDYTRQNANGQNGTGGLQDYYPGIYACLGEMLTNKNEEIKWRQSASTSMLYTTYDNEYFIANNNYHKTVFDYYKQVVLGTKKNFPTELKLTSLENMLHMSALSHKMLYATKNYLAQPAIDVCNKIIHNKKFDTELRIKALDTMTSTVWFSEASSGCYGESVKSIAFMKNIQSLQNDEVLGETVHKMANTIVQWGSLVFHLPKDFILSTDILKPTPENLSLNDEKKKEHLQTLRTWAYNTKDIEGCKELLDTVEQNYQSVHAMISDIRVEEKPLKELDFYSKVHKALSVKNENR